mmetsp:Transcript_45460/g.112902  ORF Transcript_45460/g.112902 Transcript_45460/m.112902 type:complete len:202 (-) Transcript_45460:789-1394(-)
MGIVLSTAHAFFTCVIIDLVSTSTRAMPAMISAMATPASTQDSWSFALTSSRASSRMVSSRENNPSRKSKDSAWVRNQNSGGCVNVTSSGSDSMVRWNMRLISSANSLGSNGFCAKGSAMSCRRVLLDRVPRRAGRVRRRLTLNLRRSGWRADIVALTSDCGSGKPRGGVENSVDRRLAGGSSKRRRCVPRAAAYLSWYME